MRYTLNYKYMGFFIILSVVSMIIAMAMAPMSTLGMLSLALVAGAIAGYLFKLKEGPEWFRNTKIDLLYSASLGMVIGTCASAYYAPFWMPVLLMIHGASIMVASRGHPVPESNSES